LNKTNLVKIILSVYLSHDYEYGPMTTRTKLTASESLASAVDPFARRGSVHAKGSMESIPSNSSHRHEEVKTLVETDGRCENSPLLQSRKTRDYKLRRQTSKGKMDTKDILLSSTKSISSNDDKSDSIITEKIDRRKNKRKSNIRVHSKRENSARRISF